MAKPIQIAVLILSALCFLSYLNGAQGNNDFFVQGDVYCDPCRAQFVTRLSEKLPGAKVKLECREKQGDKVIYTSEGETDASGVYKLKANGEFEDDICEVSLVSSPKSDCSEVTSKGWGKPSSRITLTSNNGMSDTVRHPNPLFFMKKEPLAECIKVYEEMDIAPPERV
ncbi:hypothetical protein Leryth_022296 [Lithospermum erythrorhizon]|uniref:Olee1-like protein n=1 Tax=Lithospermum erythrorhizon TaxID=34254 RepID=A0AAV3S307_LITER|nr:hypothetical protein Leryth_022296 [Lithospermum erythrorhizon]